MGTIILLQFPWGWTIGFLFLSIVFGIVLFFIITGVMNLTFRRSLFGGVMETWLKYQLINKSWFVASFLLGMAIYLFYNNQTAAGILILLSCIIIAFFQFLLDFIYDEMIIQRLAAHVLKFRHEIEKLQDSKSQKLSQSDDNINIEIRNKVLTDEEKKLKEKVQMLFKYESILNKKEKTKDNMLLNACESARPEGGLLFGSKTYAIIFEIIFLFLFSLAVSYFFKGLNIAHEFLSEFNGWKYAILSGIGCCIAGAIIILLINRRRSLHFCIICQKPTRKMHQTLSNKIHICSNACAQKYDYLVLND